MHSKSPSSFLTFLRKPPNTNIWAFTQMIDTSSLQNWQFITNTAVLLQYFIRRYLIDKLPQLSANWSQILILEQVHLQLRRTKQNQLEETSMLFVLGKLYRLIVGTEKMHPITLHKFYVICIVKPNKPQQWGTLVGDSYKTVFEILWSTCLHTILT